MAHRRNEYFLASKCGCPLGQLPGPLPQQHDFTRKNILDGVHQSLRRMKTDRLDLLQLHISPSKHVIDQESVVKTLQDLQREGKVRFIGSSSTLPNILDHIKMGVFDEFQIPYSALERDHEEVISQAAKAGAGIVIRGGVARGSAAMNPYAADRWNAWDKAKMSELADGVSAPEFLLRFTISHPDMTTTIVGTLNPEHLAQNVTTARKGPLPPAIYNEAKKRLATVGVAAK